MVTTAKREAFWARVDTTGGVGACWPWTGGKNRQGYGEITWEGRNVGAHRVAYTLAKGRKPRRWVLHHCDNRACCNPAHLYDGTPKQNTRDMRVRRRMPDIRPGVPFFLADRWRK